MGMLVSRHFLDFFKEWSRQLRTQVWSSRQQSVLVTHSWMLIEDGQVIFKAIRLNMVARRREHIEKRSNIPGFSKVLRVRI